ncbi:MAG: flagellar hook-associated protein FlgL [Desulfohalobiaceae bacterium]
MRVSHSSIYDNLIFNLQQSASRMVELNAQASSQKKVNAPSDDPVGTARILGLRDTIGAIDRYQANIGTAEGWLKLADGTLMQVQNLLTRLKELAVQGSTGTYTANEREAIGFEARQLFEELVALSNTSFEGASIFGGHKVDQNAYGQGLSLTSNDGAVTASDVLSLSGDSESTILVQFLADGTLGSSAIDYQFSRDGGETWQTRTLADGSTTLDLDGVALELDTVTVTGAADANDSSGSWLWVRPTAVYQGDDQDDLSVDIYSSGITGATASGVFTRNVVVRIDDTSGSEPEYSYSPDGGRTWVSGNTASDGDYLLPGGVASISGTPAAGDQIVVRPNRAAMDVEIGPGQTLQLNQVGKDIFGGLYNGAVVFEEQGQSGKNLFETVGELVGFLETNNQEGIQTSLERLNLAAENVSNHLARVGARENRLTVSEAVLSGLKLNQTDRMSQVEDVDMTELMSDLAKQQVIFEAVLKSSSMIMRMTLADYL